MKRLSGIDAGFFYMETPTLHMHTLKVAVLEPTPGSSYELDAVKAELGRRLDLLPPFRWRVVAIPFYLHHPVWIEDPGFCIDRHVRRINVEAPGGRAQMDAAISVIASVPLDRSKPLWELTMLHGLEGGLIAAVVKIHHAVADGVAAAELLANVMGGGVDASAPAEPWKAEPLPTRRKLLLDAMHDHGPNLRRLPLLVVRTLRNLAAVVRSRRSEAHPPPRPLLDAPRTPFNGALTARRCFTTIPLSLDVARRVKSALGVTLNDVFLALVASSLRGYLLRRGELPALSLVAEVPMSTDRPGASRRLTGNRVSNLFTSLCTDEEDPVARVRAIHEAVAASRRSNQILGPEMYLDWSEYTPPGLFPWAMRMYSRLKVANHHRPAINVIVSSVPGPPQPLHTIGGRLHSLFSVGPVIEGAALNITAWSYVDQLNVSILSCPDLLDSPDEIAVGLGEALAELRNATAGVKPA